MQRGPGQRTKEEVIWLSLRRWSLVVQVLLRRPTNPRVIQVNVEDGREER